MPREYTDSVPNPPEELRALCALCDVRWKFVPGRGANTWELYVYVFNRHGLPRQKYGRVVQTVDYEVWNDHVKWLVEQRGAG